MPMSLGRETFIALRARRQAYRIASEILAPPMKPPIEPPHPTKGAIREYRRFQRRQAKMEARRKEKEILERRQNRPFWLIFGCLIFILFMVVFALRMKGSM